MNVKLSLIVAIFGVLFALSTAKRMCPRTCNIMFRCSPFYKDLVWSVVDGSCRVFQNGCIFATENCSRVNSCRQKMEITTPEKCKESCNQICPFGGSGVCGIFYTPRADGTNSEEYKYFLNRCLLDQYACENSQAYISAMDGACPTNN